eukprot:530357_1
MHTTLLCTLATLFVWTSSIELSTWQLQSSSKINNADGSKISTTDYDTEAKNWYQNVSTPSTVVGGLMQKNVYNFNPYFSTNLQNIPSNDFQVPWWYRTQFSLTNTPSGSVLLVFEGINYRANLWINGKLYANSSAFVGTLVEFHYDITSHISNNINTIALEIHQPIDPIIGAPSPSAPPQKGCDLAISYIDWNPAPPDSSMGIWKPVYLDIINISSSSPNIKLRYPMVNASIKVKDKNNLSTPSDANLTIMIEVNNYDSKPQTNLQLNVKINELSININQKISLTANELNKQIFFSYKDFPELQLKDTAQLWWPYQFGNKLQKLYNISFTIGDNIMHNTRFGIRESTSFLSTKYKYLQYQFNHQNILILGGGYTGDMLHIYNRNDAIHQMEYVLDMGLNTIRLEGKWPPKWWYELADEMGILIMPGIECCDSWQNWKSWKDEQYNVAQASITSVIKNFRIHPSIFTFFASSDQLPPTNVQQLYNKVFSEQSFSNPIVAAASEATSSITGPTGVKMSGPYAWEPPNYWLQSTDTIHSDLGGAFGFLTEGGPGASPMSYDSLILTIPSKDLWPMNSIWDYHCGADYGAFGSLKYFTHPLNERYGKSNSAEEYSYKASVASYESHKAMFEAYARNKYVSSTGVIHWMLSNGWPSFIWNLYDYYLNVNGAYFGTKKALNYRYGYHAMYSYNDNSIWIITNNEMVNMNKNNNINNIICIANIRDIMNGGNIVYSKNITVSISDLNNDESKKLFDLNINHNIDLFLVQLLLMNNDMILDENIYWLSSTMDQLDWGRSSWYQTPVSKGGYADFTKLQNLKQIELKTNFTTNIINKNNKQYYETNVNIMNPTSDNVAFMVNVKMIRDLDGTSITPIIWSDNFITVFPKETRSLNATYLVSVVGNGVKPNLNVSVYNNM